MNLPIHDLVKQTKFWKNFTKNENPFIEIDNSSFTYISECNVKGVLGAVLKLVKPYEVNDLNFGSVIHDTIEAYHLGKIDNIEDTIEAHELYPLIHDEKGYKTQKKLVELAEKYVEQFERDKPYEIVKGLGGHSLVELPFRVPLGIIWSPHGDRVTVYWTGKIDLVVMKNDKLWALDHKTTKQLGQGFKDKYVRSNQFIGYYNALTYLEDKGLSHLGDIDIEGCLLNALCIRKRDVEIPEPYQLPFFERQLQEWRDNVLEKLTQFTNELYRHTRERAISDAIRLTQTRTSCHHFSKCRYWDVCECPTPDVRLKMLEGDEFVESTWDPLKKKS